MTRAFLLSALVLSLSACGKGGTSTALPQDGGAETGTLPDSGSGGTDASGDAPLDGLTSDAPTPEASDEAGAVKPSWQAMSTTVGGCHVERLANPQSIRLFDWAACSGIAGCEQAAYSPAVLPGNGRMGGYSQVGYVDGEVVASQVLFEPNAPNGAVFFTTEDGVVIDGYRVTGDQKKCASAIGAVGSGRWGVMVCNFENLTSACGGVLSAKGSTPLTFDMPAELHGSPASNALGDSRWLWVWSLPSFISSVDLSGSAFSVLLSAGKDSVKEVGGLVTTGPAYIINPVVGVDGGGEQYVLELSDGVSSPTPLLTPPPGEWYVFPGYAHSHLAWLRAVNRQSDGSFERIEVWTSKFSAVVSELSPEYVAEYGSKRLPGRNQSGGYGYYAIPLTADDLSSVKMMIWNLSTKQERAVPFPAGLTVIGGAVGMTKTHVWYQGGLASPGASQLLRFSLN